MNIHILKDYDKEAYYLEYFNAFLTVEGFGNYYGLSIQAASVLISMGRQIHLAQHSDCKPG